MAKNVIHKDDLVAAFTEWDRQYRENPKQFWNEVQHLLDHTPETYGKAAAVCLLAMLAEVRGKG